MEIIRTGGSPEELVAALEDPETRFHAFVELQDHGAESLPAIRGGLAHADWQVRKWSAMYLDHHADAESLEALLPLLEDPSNQVRLWAVHSLSCEVCKPGVNQIDIVPLLMKRATGDKSIRVRRMATAMLGSQTLDDRVVPMFKRLIIEEKDRKLKLHARNGLERYREAGVEV